MKDYSTLLSELFDNWYNPILKKLKDSSRKIRENEFKYVFNRRKYDELISENYSFEKYSLTKDLSGTRPSRLSAPVIATSTQM